MPSYYVSSILLTEPHLLLTILCGAGALFAWQNRAVRYCLVVFVGLLVFFSLFLPVYSVRYFYFYQFLLILLPCGVLFLLWDRIRELTSGWRTARLLAWGSGIAALLLVFGTATETGLKVFRLSEQTPQGRTRVDPSMRYGIVRQDTRGPAQFVASRLRPGDIVLANLTQAFYLYGGRMPDFGINTLLATRMIYLNDYAAYRHRFVGIPMVRNMRDMHNVFDQGRRVWYLGGGSLTLQAQEVKDALDLVFQRSKIVYATYHAKVYLWDGTVTPAQQTVANPALPPQPGMPAEKPAPEDRVVEELSWAENGKTLSYPRVTKSDLYPEWTHQNVSERDPAHVNAKLKVQPLQPPREPEKPNSDEKESRVIPDPERSGRLVWLALVACFVLLPIPRQLCAGQAGAVRTRERSQSAKVKPVVFLNLREYLATVTAVSPKILASRLDEAAAYYQARSTSAAYLPHLVFDAGVGYIHGNTLNGLSNGFAAVPSSSVPNRWFTQEGPGLTVPIYRDGSFLGINVPPEVTRKRAESQILKFKGSLTEQSVIVSATDAYLQAIKATHVLELGTRHFAVAQEEAERVENRATSGLATAEELGVARLLLASSRASFEAAARGGDLFLYSRCRAAWTRRRHGPDPG